jgi:hypothetical protein
VESSQEPGQRKEATIRALIPLMVLMIPLRLQNGPDDTTKEEVLMVPLRLQNGPDGTTKATEWSRWYH